MEPDDADEEGADPDANARKIMDPLRRVATRRCGTDSNVESGEYRKGMWEGTGLAAGKPEDGRADRPREGKLTTAQGTK